MKHRTYAIAAAITAIVIASATAATAQEPSESLAGATVHTGGHATPTYAKQSRQEFARNSGIRDNDIIIIDGRISALADMQALKPEQIREFTAFRMGKTHLWRVATLKDTHDGGHAAPIILVNGLEVDSLQQIRQKYVSSAKALMPEKAVEIYGEQGCNGAILFTLHETCDGKPITMQEVLSGYEWGETAPAAKPAGPDTVQIRISDISSTATPAKAAQPLTLGRAEGDETIYLIPDKAAQPLTLGRAEGDETIYLIPDLNKIRPGDIASVTVFKDKSAHTFDIYGDTSGGVLLVTFKKGRIPLPAVVETGKR